MSFDEKAILELYNKKYSDTQIAKELGIERWNVRSIRNKHDLPAHFKWPKESKTYSEEEKKQIFELHYKGLPLNKIAEEVGVNPLILSKFCKEEGLDTSQLRGASYQGHLRNEKIFNYLEENGPTSLTVLSEKLKIQSSRFPEFLRVFYDEIETIEFKVGGTGANPEILGNLCKAGKIILLRNDPRLIDFVSVHIPFELNDHSDAATLMNYLSRFLDKYRSRQIIEKLGYEYKDEQKTTFKRVKPENIEFVKADKLPERTIHTGWASIVHKFINSDNDIAFIQYDNETELKRAYGGLSSAGRANGVKVSQYIGLLRIYFIRKKPLHKESNIIK